MTDSVECGWAGCGNEGVLDRLFDPPHEPDRVEEHHFCAQHDPLDDDRVRHRWRKPDELQQEGAGG